MPVSAGTRLGPYEITGALGAGGMGEVYRARDARLGRDVAIKVLPPAFSSDPDRLARFEQEARAAAALNHPNILAVFDIGTHDHAPYIVSELLEGESLRGRLAHGALPVRKSVEYAVQIARGLAAAHEKGIVHRDLKPENVLVTPDGRVKILDFGLAKLTQVEPSGIGVSAVPTTPALGAPAPGTMAGVVLGTVGYMAPEQVRGMAADHRADIFALGAMLYEMLSGQRAFRGDTTADTMSAILKEDPPDLPAADRHIPPALDRIARRCLEKNAGERFHSAHDLAIALETLSGTSASAVAFPAAASPRRRIYGRAAAAAAVAAAVALAFFAGTRLTGVDAPSAPKYQRLTYRRGAIQSARLAPDGRTVIYAAAWDNAQAPELYSTRPESPESQKLQLQEPANLLSISRSGEMAILLRVRRVRAYAHVGTLARVSMSGGAPREMLEDVQDADWAPDGGLAISRRVDGQYRLEYPVGKILYSTAGYISDVRVSPDGERVAFLDHPVLGDNRGALAVVDRAGAQTTLSSGWDSAEGVAWSASGAEVWFTAGRGSTRALHAVGTNGRLREVAAVPNSLSVRDIGPDGRILLQSNNWRRGIFGNIAGESRDLSWFDWSEPSALSRDGSTVVITEQGDGGGSGYSIYLRKTDGSPAVRLGQGQAQALSPDGKWVLAQPLGADAAQLMLLPTGVGESKQITADTINHSIARFSSDGRRVFFLGNEPGRAARVYVQDVTGTNPRAVTPPDVTGLIVSPDDRFVLTRGADQRYAIYPVDGGEPQPLTGLEASDIPIRWSEDGRWVIVWERATAGQTQRLYRVAVSGGRRELFKEIPIPGMLAPSLVGFLQLAADAGSYVFSYGVEDADLFLVEGLR